jgi:hypothetical protein
MDNLLLTGIVIALLYYFFYHLPKGNPKPTTQNQPTQTDPEEYEPGPQQVQLPRAQVISDPEEIKKLAQEKQELLKDQAQKLRTIEGLNNSYQNLETKRKTEHETSTKQINSLQQQLNTLKTQLNHLTSQHKQENLNLEQTLDTLIKTLNQINQQLDA